MKSLTNSTYVFVACCFLSRTPSQVKDDQADAVKKRIRQWESENRVLGHQARSDVNRPRALVVLSGVVYMPTIKLPMFATATVCVGCAEDNMRRLLSVSGIFACLVCWKTSSAN